MRETNTCEKNKKVYSNDNTVGYNNRLALPYIDSWEENQDLAGWICIPGASIDYPVMMTSHEPECYIHRNKKERLDQPSLSPPQKFQNAPNWFVSTILHSSYIILFVLPYFVSCYMMDRTATMKETTLWVVISFIALTVLVALMVLSRIANKASSSARRLLIWMTTYHAPKMAGILVFLVVAASFTTAAPVAVIAAEYFAEADTKRFKIIGTVLVLAEFAVSLLGSYAQIINI